MAEGHVIIQDEDDVEEAPSTPEEVAQAENELLERCKEAHIEATRNESLALGSYLSLQMPAGHEKRRVALLSHERVKAFLAIPF